jgi:prolyl 4-hydroxylase
VLAYRVIGYLALQQASSLDLGLECLQRAAHSGDPASSFKLACHYLERERDTSSALPWLQHAASLQYPFAGELLRELSPSSIDTLPDPPLGEPSLELPFALFPANDDTAARPVSDDPAITVFDGVLDASDCAYLVFLSRPYMQRAHVIDPGGRHDGKVSEVRTSMSTYLPFEIVDFVGRFVERKIVQSVGERFDRSEPMSILRYAPGEYYRPHFDYFNPRLDISAELMKDGGQRVASAVTYLSAPSAGGGTSFPELGLHVPAAAGGTLWFRNCREDGSIDPRSLHAGDTVEHGEKWVVTKWFRERATHYVDF